MSLKSIRYSHLRTRGSPGPGARQDNIMCHQYYCNVYRICVAALTLKLPYRKTECVNLKSLRNSLSIRIVLDAASRKYCNPSFKFPSLSRILHRSYSVDEEHVPKKGNERLEGPNRTDSMKQDSLFVSKIHECMPFALPSDIVVRPSATLLLLSQRQLALLIQADVDKAQCV